jgi:hypothetical protein
MGAVSNASTSVPALRYRTVWAETWRPQRCQIDSRPGAATPPRVPGTRQESILRPAKPSRAGSRVSASVTITATVMPAMRPMIVIAVMPPMASPEMAMITVTPANSTAEPEVAMARPAASSTVMPARRCSRWRVTMKRA